MKIGYYNKKRIGERLSIVPDSGEDKAVISLCFADLRISKTGSVSLPYSLESYRRIVETLGDKWKPTLRAQLPIERLKARDILQNLQYEECLRAYQKHLLGFIDSGFDPSYPDELPEEFEPLLPPMSHQRAAINYMMDTMIERKGFALFFDMGLGKTFVTLSFLEYLIEIGEIRNALVIAPLSTLYSSWGDDIEKMTNLTQNIIYTHKQAKWKERELRDVILNKHAHIYVTNFETFRINKYREMIDEAYNIDCLVVDESSRIKNPKSLTFQKIYDFVQERNIEWRFALSGTPAPKGVTDLWSQFMFLDNGIALGENWRQFEEEYTNLLPNSKFIRIPKRNAYKDVYEKIKPYMMVFKKDDVLDLPPRMHILKLVDMESASRFAYNNLEEEGLAVINQEGENPVLVEASNILTKLQKLRQITGGFTYVGEGPTRSACRYPSRKNDAAIEIIEGVLSQNDEDKIIVWGTFKDEMDRLCDVLSEKKINHVRAFGGIGSKSTLKNIDLFKNDGSIRVMVASRASIGTGTNLQVANYAIYYSLDEDLEKYQQSLDRIYRIGQTKKVINYYLVTRDTYDERLVTLLRKKQTMQDFLTQGERITREKMRNSDILREWKIED